MVPRSRVRDKSLGAQSLLDRRSHEAGEKEEVDWTWEKEKPTETGWLDLLKPSEKYTK